MNELQIFENPEFGSIRTVEVDGEPWLVGKDVAVALGYSNPRDALAKHIDDEDKNTVAFRDGTSGNPNLTIINESGLYSLILSSKLPGAKKFKRWVTSEVLPAIRRTGGYMAPAMTKTLEDLTAAVQLLTEQVETLSTRETVSRELLPAPEAASRPMPGLEARKRWMRVVSDKLDLLSTRKRQSNRNILHQIYQLLEQEYAVSLQEERLSVMEEYGLEDCSVLAAIFYNEELRDGLQGIIDYNLAPENRGW